MSKVAIARELLRERSQEILEKFLDNIAQAQAAGNYDVAAKQLQWLMEHMPADAEGAKIVDRSVDKQADQVQKQGPVGPAIKIGIQVGGLGANSLPNPPKPSELPKVIDVAPVEEK